MYDINGDVSFDDYAIEINEDYLYEDYDVVEQQQSYEAYNGELGKEEETDIQFE